MIEPGFGEIRRWCDRLAARHGLDPQTKEELCGHLEQKLLGYLRGEIPVTCQDALILVRAHFGDADEVCGSLTGRPTWKCLRNRRALVRVAAVVAVLTVLALPGSMLALGASLRTVVLFAGSMAVLETGVLLAARVDLRSRWQRTLSAAFLLPTTAILWFVLVTGIGPPTMRIHSHSAEMKLIFSGIVTTALLGHVALLVLLALPARAEIWEERTETY